MESFWATLNTKLIFHCRFATRQQAIREITDDNGSRNKLSLAGSFRTSILRATTGSVMALVSTIDDRHYLK
jgi:hypothetical protein